MYKNFFKVSNFLNKKQCIKIIKEIDTFGEYDDIVMSGRKRLNKGSKNFYNFLKTSPASSKFFKNINNLNFFKKVRNKILNKDHSDWFIKENNFQFSKKTSGAQTGKKITNKKTNKNRNILYLDMDFSCSEKGYNRGPHRDRETRIINFLIYLNTLSKVDGGVLSFYDIKKKSGFKFPRFPKVSKLKIFEKIKAKQGVGIFFLSSPDSYHAVSKFFGKTNKKRYFIYGSFSLNKPVTWKSCHLQTNI